MGCFNNQLSAIRPGSSRSFQNHPGGQLPQWWVAQAITLTSTSSYVCSLTSCVPCMAIQSMICFWADICSPGRHCCSMIMPSLWTRRYDVCALVLLSTTLKMIRSSGYGRSSISFNESGLALINSQRLRWRLPKIAFFLNRYIICPLILCVRCNQCAQKTNKLEW